MPILIEETCCNCNIQPVTSQIFVQKQQYSFCRACLIEVLGDKILSQHYNWQSWEKEKENNICSLCDNKVEKGPNDRPSFFFSDDVVLFLFPEGQFIDGVSYPMHLKCFSDEGLIVRLYVSGLK